MSSILPHSLLPHSRFQNQTLYALCEPLHHLHHLPHSVKSPSSAHNSRESLALVPRAVLGRALSSESYVRDTMDDDGGAIVGHSNDSLLASADEMAGDYSPHTPATKTTAVQPTSARHSSTTHNGTSANETSVEVTSTDVSYPMPSEPVIWTQAVHPDSIQRLMSMENEATLETFGEASKVYSHVNPENFMMPLDVHSLPVMTIITIC